MMEENQVHQFAVQWVQHLLETDQEAEAREEVKVTASPLLKLLHESRIELQRVSCKQAEALFFSSGEEFKEYLEYR